jgi:predicted RNA-binding Zn-ribbon protein involved in translation (DUF1610 family)
MDAAPVNRQATTRRRGRPTAEEIAARPAPAPAKVDPNTGRIRCPNCGRPTLSVDGTPRKSDGATPHRCGSCGYRCARIVLLGAL